MCYILWISYILSIIEADADAKLMIMTAPRGPWRPQEAPGGSRSPRSRQEAGGAPEGSWRPQGGSREAVPGGLQEAQRGSTRPQEVRRLPEASGRPPPLRHPIGMRRTHTPQR